MEQVIEIGKKYRHYKGNVYEVIAIGKHSETVEDMVVYKSLKNGDVWIRPKYMWNDIVNNDGTRRFSLID